MRKDCWDIGEVFERLIEDCFAPGEVVEGMADDTIYNYVQGFIDGKFTREMFWTLARFKYPTHQISFHTDAALSCLRFIQGDAIHEV